jgi:glycosyltransferase involved in cell wall biosynthesis
MGYHSNIFMSQQPKISILIPSFNRAELLDKAIQSVLRQPYENLELIIIDSDSQDNSRAVMAKYKNDPRLIEIDRDDNLGPNISRQQAFEMCHGDYVLNMDSDDELSERYLEKMTAYAKEYDLDIVSSSVKIMDEKDQIRDDRGSFVFKENTLLDRRSNYRHVLKMRYGSWMHMCKRSYLQKHHYDYSKGKEMDIFAFQFFDDCKAGYVADAFYFYRLHSGNSSSIIGNARFNQKNDNCFDYRLPLTQEIKDPKRRMWLDMYHVKTWVPSYLFKYIGSGTFDYKTAIKDCKKYYHYSFFRMLSCMFKFRKRTWKVCFMILFHLETFAAKHYRKYYLKATSK